MKSKLLKTIIDIVETILMALIITFILVKFIMIPVCVIGTSMLPTLHENDFGFSFKISKNSGLNRFDTVVVKYGEKLIVKRLVGLPNETLKYEDNKLYINGEYYKEDYLTDTNTNDFSVTLNDDEYFVLGDNREVSKDSRYDGAFSNTDIVASHVLVLFPFRDFGFVR